MSEMKPVWHTISELQGRVHSIIELFREWQKGRNFETEGDTDSWLKVSTCTYNAKNYFILQLVIVI